MAIYLKLSVLFSHYTLFPNCTSQVRAAVVCFHSSVGVMNKMACTDFVSSKLCFVTESALFSEGEKTGHALRFEFGRKYCVLAVCVGFFV